MKAQPKLVLVLVAVIAAGMSFGLVYRRPASVAAQPKPSAPARTVALTEPTWSLAQSIDEAADYIARADGEDGRFVYMMTPDGGAVPQYNVLRHAGAIYALADYAARPASGERRAKAIAALDRSAGYLTNRYLRPVKGVPDVLAVWSDQKEEKSKKPTAKLGGAGLAMTALLGRARIADAGATDIAQVQALARFVLFLQKPTGEFSAKHVEDGAAGKFESLYYPGEAILGLAMLYEIDRDPRWLDAALRGIAFLIEKRRGAKTLPADHWLMIAIDRLLPLHPDAKEPPVTRDAMLDHGIALARRMVDDQRRTREKLPELDGCFTADGRTTPSATRLEGLLALDHALGDAGQAAAQVEIRAAIVKGIAFLRRAQLRSGPTQGGMPSSVIDGGASEDEKDDDDAAKHGEVRIDFVQHALSAMMRFEQLCTTAPAACAR